MWFLLCLNICCISFLFLFLFESNNFLSFWFVLELLSMGVVPHFVFWSYGLSQRCLMQYVMIMLFSSFFLVIGIMFSSFRGLFISVGVLMKLGVFPFMSWAYEIVIFSNWAVVWFLSSLLKIPFYLLFYIRSFEVSWLWGSLCSLGFIILTVNFWKVSDDWRTCWCHMMLSGSAALVVITTRCSFEIISDAFIVYTIWCTLVLVFFSMWSLGELSGLAWFYYLFLLISFPFSFAVIYKLILGLSVLYSSFFVFIFWCFYTIFEQLFLIFHFAGGAKGRSSISLLPFV